MYLSLLFLVFIATDRYTRRPKGYCFVTFQDIDDAKDAIHDANNKVSEHRCTMASYSFSTPK
jgi:RNA recognition motif-containing protein